MKPLDPRDWPRLVRPGSRVFLGGGASVPQALIASLLEQAPRLMDLELVHIHGLGPTPWIDPQYEQVLRTNSFFLTPGLREAVERGQADYTPCAMSEVPALFLSGRMPLDVALIQTTPPDAQGRCSLGVSVDVVKAALKAARLVIAQINPRMPWTGGEALIPAKRIDYFIEKSVPIPECEKAVPDDRHERIGRYAAQLVEDGATLQVGLGNSPEAVIRALKKHRHLGIHTGMFNDVLMELIQCGAVDHSQKNFHRGKIVASHVLGSRKLYRFVDRNPDLELRPSEWVNDPMVIARNDRMVAVNGARQIDLTGQVVRDSHGHRFYGGLGALQDFIRGAGRSKGGRPIIVLTSTSDDAQRSRIVTGLEPGSGVSTSRGDVHHVVTEYGIASIYGRSIRERVARLVEIAHPAHRESLLEGAHARGWLPKFFTMPVRRPGEEKGAVESKWVDFTCGRFLFRPLYPSDMRGLQEFFYSHDEDTVRLRYGYLRDRMSGESAYKLAAVDQSRDLALGLFVEKAGRQELRAIGRFYLDEGGESAEVAFVVHEATRRAGMAGFLLGELARVAKRRGIKELWASVLPENRPMSDLLVREGGAATTTDLGAEERIYRLRVASILRRNKAFMAEKQIQIVDR